MLRHRTDEGLVFPSKAGTRPVGNDQLNDVWREAQVKAGIECSRDGARDRHSFHDLARQQPCRMQW
jgi:hypothetical protein